ncbi:MAG: peptidylprolyl isomerase [Candidatus Competibacteraceae bacterium]|jgi:hypothetical protein|nr:peptidylprolyl isomerase [Candidatus Competibacteraceae bacterium]
MLGSIMQRPSPLIAALLREPLLGFALSGSLIFAVYAAFAEPEKDQRQIVITAEIIDDLVQNQAALLGRPIQPMERQLLIKQFVDQEILIREAYARGLDQRDSRVRHLLIDKMSFLVNEEPQEPTAADLQRLYENNLDRYRTPKAVSFEHVFVKSDRAQAERWLTQLNTGHLQAQAVGEEFWLGRRLERITQTEMATVLGMEFAKAVLELPQDEWHGPLQSARGWHLVRIEIRHEPQLLPLEQLQDHLREDWLVKRRNQLFNQQMSELRSRYRIEVDVEALRG